MMRNTHVPAYCPVVSGDQFFAYRGVSIDVKNVIIMACMSIVCPEAMSDIPDIDVSVAIPGIVMEPILIEAMADVATWSRSKYFCNLSRIDHNDFQT